MKLQALIVIVIAAFAFLMLRMTEDKTVTSEGARFAGLGDLRGGKFLSAANDVSAIGSVVVGYSHSKSGLEAFRWTEKYGIANLGFSNAYAVSADGKVAAGFRTLNGRSEPVCWTAPRGVDVLDMLPTGVSGAAYDVSDDGSTIVGTIEIDGDTLAQRDMAFRSTPHGGIVHMKQQEDLVSCSEVHAASADGAILVGAIRPSTGHNEACRWTRESGPSGLGFLPGHTTSTAFGVSADGSVVVGCSSDLITSEAFRWTKETGMVGLGCLPSGKFESSAHDVSADGTVVVGYSAAGNGWDAFIWDVARGMRSVRQVLVNDFQLGDVLRGWKLRIATAISADGSVIVGSGVNSDRNHEAWIARIAAPHSTDALGANRSQTVSSR